MKGRVAFRENGENAKSPYPETRGGKYNHVVTFSRAFQKFWHEGFNDEKTGRPVQYERRVEKKRTEK